MTRRALLGALPTLCLAQSPAKRLQLSVYRYVLSETDATTDFGVCITVNTRDPEVRAFEIEVRYTQPNSLPLMNGQERWTSKRLLLRRNNWNTATSIQVQTGPVQKIEVQAWALMAGESERLEL